MNTLQRIRHRIRTHGNILARRWYLVLITVLFMVPVIYAAHVATGIFYVTADILFLPPPAAVGGNTLRADPGRTVYYAAVVERQFNGDYGMEVPRGTAAPLYGSGIRHGYAVYLPNAGGQWQTNFNKPAITVEVVGETSAEVQKELDRIVLKIQKLAVSPQTQLGVKPEAFISTEVSPEKPSIAHVGIRNSRAEIALVLLTLCLSVAVAHLGDRLIHLVRQRPIGHVPSSSSMWAPPESGRRMTKGLSGNQ